MADSDIGALQRVVLVACRAWPRATVIAQQWAVGKMDYAQIRERFGLTAQAAVRSISKVADAFKVSHDVAPGFRADAAQPYDGILRFVKDGSTVSLWTMEGRMVIPIVMGEHQRRLLTHRKGEVDLCLVRGKWMLAATCDIPETGTEFMSKDWLGALDLSIVQLAVDSDGKTYSGADVERVRRHQQKRRSGLQKCGTKGAKRRLRKLAGRQARFQKHTNHCIAKAVVMDAERTSRGIALEELKGIRQRVTAWPATSSTRTPVGELGFCSVGRFRLVQGEARWSPRGLR